MRRPERMLYKKHLIVLACLNKLFQASLKFLKPRYGLFAEDDYPKNHNYKISHGELVYVNFSVCQLITQIFHACLEKYLDG